MERRLRMRLWFRFGSSETILQSSRYIGILCMFSTLVGEPSVSTCECQHWMIELFGRDSG